MAVAICFSSILDRADTIGARADASVPIMPVRAEVAIVSAIISARGFAIVCKIFDCSSLFANAVPNLGKWGNFFDFFGVGQMGVSGFIIMLGAIWGIGGEGVGV